MFNSVSNENAILNTDFAVTKQHAVYIKYIPVLATLVVLLATGGGSGCLTPLV